MRPTRAGLVVCLIAAGCNRSNSGNEAGSSKASAEQDRAMVAEAAAVVERARAATLASAQRRNESVKPVYAADGAVDPLADRLCKALHRYPEERRAACCRGPVNIELSEPCARTLSAALRSGAVAIGASPESGPSRVEACEAALRDRYAGCEWVGPLPEALPETCRHLTRGTLLVGAPCRSSLECAGSLRCVGAGPTATGSCAPARPLGAGCSLAVDALGAALRLDDVDGEHPECAGYCDSHRCVPLRALAGACTSSVQCGRDRHCAAGRCVEGARARVGGACSGGDCEPGARCVSGACVIPAPSGTSCGSDFECRGACLSGDGGRRCGMDCTRR